MHKKIIAAIALVMATSFSIESLHARAAVKALLAISALNTAHMGTERDGILTKQFWGRPLHSKNRAKLARLLLLSVSPVVAAALLHQQGEAPATTQPTQAIAPTAPSSASEALQEKDKGDKRPRSTPKPTPPIVVPLPASEDPRCIVEPEVGEAEAIHTVIPQMREGINVTRKRLNEAEATLKELERQKMEAGNACSKAVCELKDPEYDRSTQESYKEFEALQDALKDKGLYELWDAAKRVAGRNYEERELKNRYAEALAAAPDVQALLQRYTENEERRNAIWGECMERARCTVSPEYAALAAREEALQKELHALTQEHESASALLSLQHAAEDTEVYTTDRFVSIYPKHKEAIEKSPGFTKATQKIAAAQAALQAEYPEFVTLTTQLEKMHQKYANLRANLKRELMDTYLSLHEEIEATVEKLASLKKSLEKDARFAELCRGIEPLAAYKRAMLKELDEDYAQTRAEYLAALKERQEAIKSQAPLIKKLTALRASGDDEAESDEE
ncbi:MAG: hypothetical protein QG604_965 [Candidatus Dependentiae bacterium]|nr:hypothetical protein [Candidatus Dependentiae bacterium]